MQNIFLHGFPLPLFTFFQADQFLFYFVALINFIETCPMFFLIRRPH